jgi:hypothetical protein
MRAANGIVVLICVATEALYLRDTTNNKAESVVLPTSTPLTQSRAHTAGTACPNESTMCAIASCAAPENRVCKLVTELVWSSDGESCCPKLCNFKCQPDGFQTNSGGQTPDGCLMWFDGCNYCSQDGACTKLYCTEPGAARCETWESGYDGKRREQSLREFEELKRGPNTILGGASTTNDENLDNTKVSGSECHNQSMLCPVAKCVPPENDSCQIVTELVWSNDTEMCCPKLCNFQCDIDGHP